MFNAIIDFLFNGVATEISLAISKAWTSFMVKRNPGYNSSVSGKVIKVISAIISIILGLAGAIIIAIILMLIWLLFANIFAHFKQS